MRRGLRGHSGGDRPADGDVAEPGRARIGTGPRVHEQPHVRGGRKVEVGRGAGDELVVHAIGGDARAEQVPLALDHDIDRLVGRIDLGQLDALGGEPSVNPEDQHRPWLALLEIVRRGHDAVLRRGGGTGRLPHHQPGSRPGRLGGRPAPGLGQYVDTSLKVTGDRFVHKPAGIRLGARRGDRQHAAAGAFRAGQARAADVLAGKAGRAVRVRWHHGNSCRAEGVELAILGVHEEQAAGHRHRAVDRRGQLIAVE